MFLAILIIFFTLIGLMVLHELGHFLLAKRFGVRVEEFGVGYPPRIFGKKIGETVYSLNLLPFGAFVKITGEEERVEHPRSFSQKPIWQRALILSGGVVSFWIVAIIILTFVIGIWGLPSAIPDDFGGDFLAARVQILDVAADSPAETAGIKAGDEIIRIKNFTPTPKFDVGARESRIKKIEKVQEVQEFVALHKGEEVLITLQRGKEVLEVSVIPRVSPPEGEGAIGVSLMRTANVQYAWYQAPFQSCLVVGRQTIAIPKMLTEILGKAVQGEKVDGVAFVGPIGIGELLNQALAQGVGNFLAFVSMISVWLALFNLFPIPALDGGRLLFLFIEGVRRKPFSQKIEQRITGTCFLLLIALMIFVTIKDIIKLF